MSLNRYGAENPGLGHLLSVNTRFDDLIDDEVLCFLGFLGKECKKIGFAGKEATKVYTIDEFMRHI